MRALFYLMEKAATYLPPKWHENPWCKQAFKAAAIATLNRIIQDGPSEAPEKIKASWEAQEPGVALTAEAYGRQLEWAVDIFVKMTPDFVPFDPMFPVVFRAGSVNYAMPKARAALGIPFDEKRAKELRKLMDPSEGGQ